MSGEGMSFTSLLNRSPNDRQSFTSRRRYYKQNININVSFSVCRGIGEQSLLRAVRGERMTVDNLHPYVSDNQSFVNVWCRFVFLTFTLKLLIISRFCSR